MAALFILLSILYLINICEMHPQYNRSLQNHPIVEIVPLEGRFEAPISSRGHSPLSFIEMKNEILRTFYPENPIRLHEENPSYMEPLSRLVSTAKLDDSLDKDVIVFPGPTSRDVLFVPPVSGNGPICAANGTTCENLDDNIPYPTDYITKLVESYVQHGYMEPLGNEFVTKVDVSQRMGADDDSICSSFKKVEYPKIVPKTEEEWFYTVNTEELRQGIEVEVCTYNSIDERFTKYMPMGTKIFCKQKYLRRKLIYIDEKGKLNSDLFKLPSCCACFEDNNIRSRMGSLQTPANYNSSRLDDVLDKQDTVLPRPTPGNVSFLPRVGINGPACAAGGAYCEDDIHYPTDYIIKLVKEKPEQFLELYGFNSKVDLSQRIDEADESSICPSDQHSVTPRIAQNKEGKWFYIVNVPNLVQIVDIEKCTRDQPSLFMDDYYGYTVTCKQINMHVEMHYLTENGELKYDFFILPSCCKCSVQNTENKRRR